MRLMFTFLILGLCTGVIIQYATFKNFSSLHPFSLDVWKRSYVQNAFYEPDVLRLSGVVTAVDGGTGSISIKLLSQSDPAPTLTVNLRRNAWVELRKPMIKNSTVVGMTLTSGTFSDIVPGASVIFLTHADGKNFTAEGVTILYTS